MKFTPALAAAVLLSATACSTIGDGGEDTKTNDQGKITDVVLASHVSFALPKELVEKFETDTGYHLVIRPNGDAGELTSKLVLTKDDPIGDVAFGVDNTFAGRATS
ncbi:MAG TPA: thiamine ABC transporter substrate-binding protein, partial [Nocardioides sp.]